MTKRRRVIAIAKEAYRLFITRAIHAPGFNHFGKGYVFVRDEWVVYLNINGTVQSTRIDHS